MNTQPSRRGLLRGLVAGLFGCAATTAGATAARSEAPPHCPHYYDGVLWRQGRPCTSGHYRRDDEGCPYCRAEELAKKSGRTPMPAGCQTTTYVYDPDMLRKLDRTNVTTYTYDRCRRLTSVTGAASPAPSSQTRPLT